MSKLKMALSIFLAATLITGLSACSPGKLDISQVTSIIDIRPAADFNKSHIVGAVNLDVTQGDIVALATSFGRTGKYYIYGTDENQVGAAIMSLTNRGYTDLTNLGDFANAKRILPLGVTN